MTAQIDKRAQIEDAIGRVGDGMTVMIGGFGVPGTPFCLIEELVRQGPRNLTVIKNDSNESGMGVDCLLRAGMVAKLVTSHIGLNGNAVRMMNAGEVAVEFVAQGILAERIRAAGAGLMGFVTDIGIDTALADGKEEVTVSGERFLFEPSLQADIALVHAERADRLGNLTFRKAARNFNPLMAMAARHVIAEAEAVLEPGEIGADDVHTPAPFVDDIVALRQLPEVYGVIQR